MRGDQSRLLFIDSTVNTNGDQSRINLPPHPFSAVGNERMSLTLLSMSIRRNWYNINPTNNIFYLYTNSTFYECYITPGVYATFGALETEIQAAVNRVLPATVTPSLWGTLRCSESSSSPSSWPQGMRGSKWRSGAITSSLAPLPRG